MWVFHREIVFVTAVSGANFDLVLMLLLSGKNQHYILGFVKTST